MDIWPVTLQQKLNADGFEKRFGNTVIRSETDIGPAKVRSRFTDAVDSYRAEIFLDFDEYEDFQTFFKVTLANGSKAFLFKDPFSELDEIFRFIDTPLITPLGGRVFRVSMNWERLPTSPSTPAPIEPGPPSTNIAWWLRADRDVFTDTSFTTPAVATNDAVASWKDASTGLNHVFRSGPLTTPTYKINAINGKPAVVFASQSLIAPTPLIFTNCTIFIVTKDILGGAVVLGRSSSTQNYIYTQPSFVRFYPTNAPFLDNSNNYVPGSYNIIRATLDGINIKTKVGNGTEAIQANTSAIELDSISHYGGSPWAGGFEVAELLIYTGQLSPQTIADVETYFNGRYGI